MKRLIFFFVLILAMSVNLNAQKNDTYTLEADEFPRFPGCENIDGSELELRQCADAKLFAFIGKNLSYPKEAREKGVEGTVFIKFKIDEEGRIMDPVIAEDIGASCGDAALAVMKKMAKEDIRWTPAKLKGKNVPIELSLPFKFSL